jgi:hypothetical protein
LRAIAAGLPRSSGLVVLGSGSIPLATAADVRDLVDVAASGERRALANNRYSADVVAVGQPEALRDLPDLPSDNTLPRWLEEIAGFEVEDLRRRWRLAIDLDSPLDGVLLGWTDAELPETPVHDRLAAIREVAADRRAELVVAGRSNGATLAWLERSAAARTRWLIEERGLRASSPAALPQDPLGAGHAFRPPRSILGLALDDRGPEALGAILAELGDAAVIDTRVLLAHRLGADEASWPGPEDRFASDLLLAGRVADPWLRALTASAAGAPIPIVLGGHTLVGPGIRLVIGRR